MDKICKFFEIDFNYFIDEIKYNQINKPNAIGYLAETQNIQQNEKLNKQYELRIKEKDEYILLQNNIIANLKDIISKKNNELG